MTASRARLPAAERRAAVIDTACRVFSKGSYRGTTTAEIARESGVTEPVLYRHFESKRELYLACLDEAWRRVRATWTKAIDEEPDPAEWLTAMRRAFRRSETTRVTIANLWLQALVEASQDPAIRRYLRGHMREVHEFVAEVIRRAQEAGGVLPEHDARAEAWIFISVGLLASVSRRLGGILENDIPLIAASRRRWLTGRA